MEGANLHRPTTQQQRVVQLAQTLKLVRGGLLHQAPVQQLLAQLGISLAGKLQQPLLQALAHFASGFLGEGYGQNFVRRTALQQCPQHARHQHPGLAGTGTSLHGNASARVTGDGVKAGALYGDAVVFKGCLAIHVQKSFRHRPRA